MSTSFAGTSSTRRLFGRTVLVALLAGTSSCVPSVRIPLPVPLPSVGGSRPATPQGLHLALEFGDGVWGQEQERVEMGGGGLGISVGDRIELGVSGYGATRRVQSRTSATTTAVRGKVRLGDFAGGRASVGLHVTGMASGRLEGDQVVNAVLLPDVVEGADVRVVEAGDGSGFTFKAFPQFGSLGQVLGQDLEGDLSVQAAVFSEINFALASRS